MLCTSLEYHVLVTLPLLVLSPTVSRPVCRWPSPACWSPWRLRRGGRRRPDLPAAQAPLVVAAAGGPVVFPPAHRPRLGPLPGPARPPPARLEAARNARLRRAARERANASTRSATSPIRACSRAGIRRRHPRRPRPQGLAEQGRHRLERVRCRSPRQPLGTSAPRSPPPRIMRRDKRLIRCRLRAGWSLQGQGGLLGRTAVSSCCLVGVVQAWFRWCGCCCYPAAFCLVPRPRQGTAGHGRPPG